MKISLVYHLVLLQLVFSFCSGRPEQNKSILGNFGNFKFPGFNLFNVQFWKKTAEEFSTTKHPHAEITTPAKLFDKVKGWMISKLKRVVSVPPNKSEKKSYSNCTTLTKNVDTTLENNAVSRTTTPSKSTKMSVVHTNAVSTTRLIKSTTQAILQTSSSTKRPSTNKTSVSTTTSTAQKSTTKATSHRSSNTTSPSTRKTSVSTTPIADSTANLTTPLIKSTTKATLHASSSTENQSTRPSVSTTHTATAAEQETSTSVVKVTMKISATPSETSTTFDKELDGEVTTLLPSTTATCGSRSTTTHGVHHTSKMTIAEAATSTTTKLHTAEPHVSISRSTSHGISSGENLSTIEVNRSSNLNEVGSFTPESIDKVKSDKEHSHEPVVSTSKHSITNNTYIVYQNKEFQYHVMPDHKEPIFHSKLWRRSSSIPHKTHIPDNGACSHRSSLYHTFEHKSANSHVQHTESKQRVSHVHVAPESDQKTHIPDNGKFSQHSSSYHTFEQKSYPHMQHEFAQKASHSFHAGDQKTSSPFNRHTLEENSPSHRTYEEKVSHSDRPHEQRIHPFEKLEQSSIHISHTSEHKMRHSDGMHQPRETHSYNTPEQRTHHERESFEQKNSHCHSSKAFNVSTPHSYSTYEHKIGSSAQEE